MTPTFAGEGHSARQTRDDSIGAPLADCRRRFVAAESDYLLLELQTVAK